MEMVRILDHGHLRLIETWGSDERIIEAARMSTSGGFVSWGPYDGHPNGDAGLLAYLYRNGHSTPFEMAGAVFEVTAPIFVFREWHRHRTQSYNEMSARYVPLPDENYVPTAANVMTRACAVSQNRQAHGTGRTPTESEVADWLRDLHAAYAHGQQVYLSGLERGIPKELARLCLPVARYSRMRASANLRNWLGFLSLRMSLNAQWEIRQYAAAVAACLREKFPRTMELFDVG